MANNGCLFTFYTMTPLHAGAGDSAGAIDLPVQRERHTEYPVVHSSGIKGSLRDFFEKNSNPDTNDIFGIEGNDQTDSTSGKVVFTDAKILLFPVRSSRGVFKWVTCPFVITRLLQDMEMAGIVKPPITLSEVSEYNGFTFNNDTNPIILEDFKIELKKSNNGLITELFVQLVCHFEKVDLIERLIIVSDNVFKTLVTTATQIIARNVLKNETKKSTNLWYEEVVPADALFYTLMLPVNKNNFAPLENLKRGINGQVLQIGGNETIGYGIIKMSNSFKNNTK